MVLFYCMMIGCTVTMPTYWVVMTKSEVLPYYHVFCTQIKFANFFAFLDAHFFTNYFNIAIKACKLDDLLINKYAYVTKVNYGKFHRWAQIQFRTKLINQA